MNYEEKYKKALETANAKIETYYHLGNTSVAKSIEEIFPELQESEDERMRKMAIKAVNSPEAQSCIKSWGVEPKDVIAWLEKQGKYKSVTLNEKNIADVFEKVGLAKIVREQGNDELMNALQMAMIELAKQEEQKPTDKVEPKFKVGDIIRYKNSGAVFTIKSVFPDHYSLTNNEGLLYFMFQDKYELVEQKPAWSEDDKNAIKVLMNIIKKSEMIDPLIYTDLLKEKLYDWLKSLKERMKGE